MKNSKRLLATLLTLCIMASFVFTGTAFAAGEAAVTLTFPAQIVNVNGTASLSLTGATADSWESSDDAIATVENGVVTGKAIGRVTITAKSGEEAIASIEIPVVGENLLIRNGVNHGEFEGGQNSVWTDRPARLRSTHAKGKVGFWAAPIDSNVNTYQESSTVIQGESPLGTTNLLKCSNTTTDAGVNSVYIGTSYFKNTSETTDYGAVKLDTDKMYEFTGWAKFEATEGTTTTFNGNARIFYYDDVDHASSTFPDKTDPAVSKGNMKNYLTEISATTDWCFFNTTPHDLWSYKNTVSYTGDTYMQPRISMKNVNGWLGDFYVSNLSFHEVVYDPVFKSNKGLNNAKVGFYASTTFQHLSNTGKEVKSFDANGAEEAIPVTYESLTPEVATITYREDDGTKKWMIDAVGAGEAVITATANLGGKEYTRTITFTVAPDEDQALVDAFDATIEKGVSYDAPTVAGVTVEGGVIKASESGDGTFTLTADAEDKDGNKFLYWAKGKTLGKKIISFSNVLTNYMPEANDKNHILIAVYE
ncbi:MAG: hypothetical protein IJ949_03510, partial [Oscillospiraceae bacterium]|nr:hypothetical protein [Oscillospiraceae bacterium]